MEKYEAVEIELITFDNADVIACSYTDTELPEG